MRRSKTVEVYITLPEVQALHLNGSGSITSQSHLTTNEMPVSVNGSGKIDLEVTASKVITQLTGSGDVVLRGTAREHQWFRQGSRIQPAFG